MELSDLTAYAMEKYHIPEEHPWPSEPGLSVLNDPETGQRIALLFREWDTDTGQELQRCDLKCGQSCLKKDHPPFLTRPLFMRGSAWAGIILDGDTDRETVLRLFDRTVSGTAEKAWSNAITLDEIPGVQKGSDFYRETAIPAGPPKVPAPAPEKRSAPAAPGERERARKDLSPRRAPEAGSSGPYAPLHPSDVPDRILQMRSLYEYGGGSLRQKAKNFYRQGKFMEDYVDHLDDPPWTEDYGKYFPTYHSLNIRQLRSYFTWRTKLREGNIWPASLSFVYLYLYELLCGIGTSSPEDSLRKMAAFETSFLDSGKAPDYAPEVRRNLRRWMYDYAILHEFPVETIRSLADPDAMKKDHQLEVLRNPDICPDEEVFTVLDSMYEGKLAHSPVITRCGDAGKHLFAEVWRTALSAERRDGQDLFVSCFGEAKTSPWQPLANAVYWEDYTPADTDIAVDGVRSYRCRDAKWTESRYLSVYFDYGRLRGLLREADRAFRRYRKTGGYLREREAEKWAAPYAEAVIARDRAQEAAAAAPAAPDITIDFASLEKIRHDADLTRQSLMTEEASESTPVPVSREDQKAAQSAGPSIHPPHPATQMSAPDAPEEGTPGTPDPLYRHILEELLRGKPVDTELRKAHLLPAVVTDAVNEAFFDAIGDSILECTGDGIRLVEDYREDVRALLEGSAGTPPGGSGGPA